MKVIKSIIFSILLFSLLTACDKSLDYKEYKRWITDTDNGLHVVKNIQEYEVQVQYQPNEFLNAQLQQGGRGDKEESDFQQYILTLGIDGNKVDFMKYNTTNTTDYQKKEYYFSYLFQNDIVLEENGQQHPCILYHFEKSNNLKNTISIVLGFKDDIKAPESTLIIKSKILSELPIKIKISKKNIPQLAYETSI